VRQDDVVIGTGGLVVRRVVFIPQAKVESEFGACPERILTKLSKLAEDLARIV
jgi:hypothetical protein